MSNYYVYVIQSIQYHRRYVGFSSDYIARLKHHNSGSNSSTKPYRPYKLVYFKQFESKKEALIYERKLKSYKGGRALKNLISCWDAGVDNRNGL